MRSVPRSVADPLGANDEQRHRDAERAGGGAARGRAAGRVRVVVVGVRRPARAAQARGPAAGADLALRGVQGGRRAVRGGVAPALRRRDGRAALLQRLRPAPGPGLGVRGGDPALHPVGACAARRWRSTATASSRATSPTSTTSSTPTAWPPRRRTSPAGLQRGLRRSREPARHRRAAGGAARARRRAAPHAGRGPATCRTPWPTSTGPSALLGYTPLVDFDEGLRRTLSTTSGGRYDAPNDRSPRCSRRSSWPRRGGRRRAAQAPQNLVVQAPDRAARARPHGHARPRPPPASSSTTCRSAW